MAYEFSQLFKDKLLLQASKRASKKLICPESGSTLFGLVFEGKTASSTLVDDWIDTYQVYLYLLIWLSYHVFPQTEKL